MQLLIKNATFTDPASKYHGDKASIFIKNGKIERIGKRLKTSAAKVFDAGGAYVSPGWLDIGTKVGDPGFEHREDFRSVEKAAAAGGYTAIACLPNTSPAIHSKSEVLYVKNSAKNSLVDFLPIGAVSENCAGKDITEMYDMRAAGAVAFSDGKKPVQDSGLIMRALQYVQPFGGVILNQPLDHNVAQNGQLHEGVVSTSLGLRGIPAMAEELIVQRDIYLSEYTDSNLHLLNISTAESVRLVRLAKKKGLKVTASVAALNLAFTDGALHDFDSNFKVLPPLRSEKDRKALIAGLKDGTIDCIASNHTPMEAEVKELEFSYAKFGAIGLQTAFSLSLAALEKQLPLEDIVGKFAFGTRKVLGLPVPSISEGDEANLTLFDPGLEWTFHKKNILSKSKNTPLAGKKFKGKAIALVRGKRLFELRG
ncbi:MAG TPA: dihydroorotase [Bacteroidetes bacterium]|nr:dihydroorotase [Bacteroidota bacterium]